MKTLPIAIALLGSACTTSEPVVYKRVFVTSETFSPNLVEAGGDSSLDGPANGDLICNREAAAHGLGGTWTAWLSVGDGSALGRDNGGAGSDAMGYSHASYNVAALDRLTGDGPWVSIGSDNGTFGEIVFENRAAIAVHDIQTPIYEETGDSFGYTAWTGTDNLGQPTSSDCVGWTDGLGSGGHGLSAIGTAGAITIDMPQAYWSRNPETTDPEWNLDPVSNPPATAEGVGEPDCSERAGLYCFEN